MMESFAAALVKTIAIGVNMIQAIHIPQKGDKTYD
jgi:hypothetical protein